MQRVGCVCISHMHGDHYFGLIGMLNSMHLLGRKKELVIICPGKLLEVIHVQFDAAGGRTGFPVRYVLLDEVGSKTDAEEIVFSDKYVTVSAFRLKHRIPCYGFKLRENPRPKSMRREAIDSYEIPYTEIEGIRNGNDFYDAEGNRVPNEAMTFPAPPPRTYAYCTDTLPLDYLPDIIKQVDVLYHEATFMGSEAERAVETFHSTAGQAAEIARKSKVGKLLVGHFSARYRDLKPLLDEARDIFPQTYLAIEGETFEI